MGWVMAMNHDAEALSNRDYLPLSWALLPEPPDAASLERLAETNVTLLTRLVSLEERPSLPSEQDELEKEISRLHGKLDLLITLVAELARGRQQLPPPVEIQLSAHHLIWSQALMPPAGAHVMISLHLNPCLVEPLRLPAEIERNDGERVTARFEYLSESCRSALERHVFLHHRRSIAEIHKQAGSRE